MDQPHPDRLAPFVDGVGLAFQNLGASRLMGRIIGWLLVCDPPHQSEAQLCEALGASKGAVNTLVRQLVDSGLLERVAVPGERATPVRLRDDAWVNNARKRFVVGHGLRRIALEGLEALRDAPPERRRRLVRFHDFYDFMMREIEPLIDRYDAREDER